MIIFNCPFVITKEYCNAPDYFTRCSASLGVRCTAIKKRHGQTPDPNGDDRQRTLGRNMRVARQQMWIDTGFWAYEMEYSVVWSTCQLRVNGRVGVVMCTWHWLENISFANETEKRVIIAIETSMYPRKL